MTGGMNKKGFSSPKEQIEFIIANRDKVILTTNSEKFVNEINAKMGPEFRYISAMSQNQLSFLSAIWRFVKAQVGHG